MVELPFQKEKNARIVMPVRNAISTQILTNYRGFRLGTSLFWQQTLDLGGRNAVLLVETTDAN